MISRAYDSNILIDWLNGVAEADIEFGACEERVISIITWIEVLAGAHSAEAEAFARLFMAEGFVVVPIDDAIAERTVALRQSRSLKLLDAIIHATALHRGVQLVTRNTKDFSLDDPSIRVPYQL